tara:strand:+ start:1148 stop:1546 length:399 start_codon:yes stop_codon:yes gene_type:complete
MKGFMTEEANKIEVLVKQLGQLTVVEAGQLAKQLEKEWDLDLDSLTAGAGAQAAAPVDEGKTEFDVLLTGFDDSKKIAVLKAIKTIKDIGLMDAKKFVEGDLPATVADEVSKEQAEKFKKDIEDAGGQVQLK